MRMQNNKKIQKNLLFINQTSFNKKLFKYIIVMTTIFYSPIQEEWSVSKNKIINIINNYPKYPRKSKE